MSYSCEKNISGWVILVLLLQYITPVPSSEHTLPRLVTKEALHDVQLQISFSKLCSAYIIQALVFFSR